MLKILFILIDVFLNPLECPVDSKESFLRYRWCLTASLKEPHILQYDYKVLEFMTLIEKLSRGSLLSLRQ